MWTIIFKKESFGKETTVNIVTLLMKRLRDVSLKPLETHNYEELLTFIRLSLNRFSMYNSFNRPILIYLLHYLKVLMFNQRIYVAGDFGIQLRLEWNFL